jgi:regulator of protease activity HflC (stomatin/prohibitin superfamily)/DNA-binding transcriptional regulator YhcF (GntR family)
MAQSFNIDARDPTPLYAQLERAIRFSIATGRLSVGDQLPTVRQLAVDLRINANTVAKVYTELERVGIVETRRGVGTFVRVGAARCRRARNPAASTGAKVSRRRARARLYARRGSGTPRGSRQRRSVREMANGLELFQGKKNLPAPGAPRANVVSAAMLFVPVGVGIAASVMTGNPVAAIVGTLLGLLLAQSPRVAKQWERGVVLRLGKYVGLRGPGLFWVVPLVDSVSTYVDQRVITTSFAAEQTLTSDTVPVNVDAVLFWMVYDVEKAALEVQDYPQAVSWAAQTALRDIIGRTSLTELLRGRERIEDELQQLIDSRSNPWGVTVQSVEMRDVIIPDSLQDAMSREAQASREKQARIILAEAEVEIAHMFQTAAHSYEGNPTALHLRAMNMLYEGLKEKGALMLVPSSAVESMGMGGLLGAAAFRQQQLTEQDPQKNDAL